MKKEQNSDDQSQESKDNQKLIQRLTDTAKKEVQRSPQEIYNEVVFDEINQELLKAVQKAEGELIVVLLRQERLASL